jgi:hypothetical protein
VNTVYIRPGGGHFHTSKDCVMLRDGDFERLRYHAVGVEADPTRLAFVVIAGRKYYPCVCASRERRK